MRRSHALPILVLVLMPHLASIGCGGKSVTAAQPTTLAGFVAKAQAENVKQSYGELAYECFTWDDLSRFTGRREPARIAEALKRSKSFLEVVVALQKMPSGDRDKLFKECRHPLRPTWAQLGRISREGQTDAGVQAEQLIADAIVDLAQQLVELPEGEIQKLLDRATN